jgi:hypothetical protein
VAKGKRFARAREFSPSSLSHFGVACVLSSTKGQIMRLLLWVLALYHGANGLLMVAAPLGWFRAVPGVAETGAANAHFIADVGWGFLAAAVALALAARGGPGRGPLVLAALVFLGGHAAMHVLDFLRHGFGTAALRDSAMVVLPGLLPFIPLLKGQDDA